MNVIVLTSNSKVTMSNLDNKVYLNALLSTHYWTFLNREWPIIERKKFHRTEMKQINHINEIKNKILSSIGIIPTFFFLTVLFSEQQYPGPYNNVEKGLLILYHLVTGKSMQEMRDYIPTSSFHAIYSAFYHKKTSEMSLKIDQMLEKMFSTAKIRIISAMKFNPSNFKSVTLMLDGHDTRATYLGNSDKARFYSYKFKKSGFRTQVCIDINSMILFVSQSASCRDNNDGTMMLEMQLERKMSQLDCVVLDGGYTLFINKVIENSSDKLTRKNFLHPIRKNIGIDLSSDELQYNKELGSFRSRIESLFGELIIVFGRFNNKKPVRVTDFDSFNLQLKIAFLLLNIKRFVTMMGIVPLAHHSQWMQNNFDYTDNHNAHLMSTIVSSNIQQKLEDSVQMLELQKEFLNMEIEEENSEEAMDSDKYYEVEQVINHRKRERITEYLVKWKGYAENSWIPERNFNDTECIKQYLSKKQII